MDDQIFLQQFENCTLRFHNWTHRAHVKVAYLYLRRFAFDEVIARMRTGIQRYNAANKFPQGPTTGYNETTTQAFMRIIHAVMSEYESVFLTETADELCDTHPQLLSKHILRLFYSPDQRMHPDAATKFVEPDLTPLPRPRSVDRKRSAIARTSNALQEPESQRWRGIARMFTLRLPRSA